MGRECNQGAWFSDTEAEQRVTLWKLSSMNRQPSASHATYHFIDPQFCFPFLYYIYKYTHTHTHTHIFTTIQRRLKVNLSEKVTKKEQKNLHVLVLVINFSIDDVVSEIKTLYCKPNIRHLPAAVY